MFRKLPVLFILFALLISVFFQVSRVSAQEAPLTDPITAPVTSPSITPSIPPITTPVPVPNFNLIGNVVYKQLGRLFGNMSRIIPAQNVMVNVTSFFNHNQKYTTMTDNNGNYSVQVPNGFYEVTIGDTKHTFFVPPLRVVTIKDTKKVANFEGLIFPHF